MNNHTGIPRSGWMLQGVIDLEPQTIDDYATCEWCGKERIRFVHQLSHLHHFEELAVGCVCSGRLTNDIEAAKQAEKTARNLSAQRQRFPKRKWKATRHGGKTILLNNRRVTVAKKAGGFRLWIGGKEGRRIYTTEIAAMLAAFDHIKRR
jgi:hypothetical protein